MTSVKGPLKYLVAKLHGCYARAISLPVSQNIFAGLFFGAGPSPIQVAGDCCFSSSLQQSQEKLFVYIFIDKLSASRYNA